MFFILQLTVRAGITVRGIFNYKLTPQLSTEVCYVNSITIKNCVGIYHQWSDNEIVLNVWYELREVKWCKNKWSIFYVSLYMYMYF